MKVERTLVFAEGTDLQKLLNHLAMTGLFSELRGYPNYEIVESATGKAVMKAPSIVGEAEEAVWDMFSKAAGFVTINRPEYANYLFAFEK